jgi:predicted RNA-binding protein with RPS1 domain
VARADAVRGPHEFLNQLQKGQIRKGVVSSIVNFGAFVDLGGVDGLVHVSELSWKHIDHPSEVVEVGDEVTVEVLDVDMDRERVSLSLKATQEDPWQQFARTHAIGQVVPGKVTKLVPFGAFVRVEEGIEGLVHISELAERHVEMPEQVVTSATTSSSRSSTSTSSVAASRCRSSRPPDTPDASPEVDAAAEADASTSEIADAAKDDDVAAADEAAAPDTDDTAQA